ncbi:aldo/keto reductase, partial [Streptomyces sp. NPDC001604]|uniref:aldo/keto reductase n=1 Tax=Streptomyces sp. NPDC001604 TaxID=3364593 RepID=UPI0036CEAAEB
MHHRKIQNTPVTVTDLGFGASVIGNLYRVTPADEATAAVDAAWEAGIRYFDTAPHYGLGLSERRLGAALRDRPRQEYAISSKVGRLLVPNERPRGVDDEGFVVRDDLRR